MPEQAVRGLNDLNKKGLGLQGTGIECDMDFAISSTGKGPFFPPKYRNSEYRKWISKV